MNPGTREEGEVEQATENWPLLYAERDCGRNRNPYAFQRAESRVSDTEHQTYHPESAPNVLTREKARLLTTIAAEYYGTHGTTGELMATEEIRSFLDRLKAWAEEEGH